MEETEASTDCWSSRKRHVSLPVCLLPIQTLISGTQVQTGFNKHLQACSLQESATNQCNCASNLGNGRYRFGSMQCSSPQESPSRVSSQACFKDALKMVQRADHGLVAFKKAPPMCQPGKFAIKTVHINCVLGA